MINSGSTASQRYGQLSSKRHFYLSSAEKSAALTIPSVFPTNIDQKDRSDPIDFPQPWQSFGSFATESLASKFLMTSFPPSQSFFRYQISEQEVQNAITQGVEAGEAENLRLEIQKALATRERTINAEFESGTYRVGLAEIFRQLIIAGNVLAYMPPDGTGIQVFNLGQYVIQRGPMGTMMELIVRECFLWGTLPDSVRELAQAQTSEETKQSDDIIEVFTRVSLEDGYHKIHQEAFEQIIPGSESKIREEKSPWLPLRFTHITGESYGRSFVENYRGALLSLDILRRSIVEASAAAARTIFMVRPNGQTKVRNLQNAPNGSYITGSPDDVAPIRVEKNADLAIAQQSADTLVQELSYAFLLNSAVRRDAERVTAEEIRALSAELESASGGAWSVLSQELQLPIVLRLESMLEKQGKISKLPGDSVRPIVVTGLQAIGRRQDLVTVRELLQDLAAAAALNPQVAQYIDAHDLASKILIGHGVPEDGLLKTKQEVQQEMQAAQQQAAQQQLMDRGMEAIPGILQEGASNQMMSGEGGELGEAQ